MGMEAQNIVQRYVCHLSDIATTKLGKLQQAFGDHAMSTAQDFCWHKIFSEGRTLVKNEQCSRLPSAKWTGDNTAWVGELF